MAEILLKIDDLAARVGVPTRTIRFYAQNGLLPPPERFKGRVALYGQVHVNRLVAIKELKERYVPLAVIRQALDDREKMRALRRRLSTDADVGGEAGVEGEPLSLGELARSAGCRDGEIEALTRAGWLNPEETSSGPSYSKSDLQIARLLKTMGDRGLEPEELVFFPEIIKDLALTMFLLTKDKTGDIGELAAAQADLLRLVYSTAFELAKKTEPG